MEICERVKAGAAFLDEKEPGWERRVKLTELKLDDAAFCVLGQLHGDYYDGLDEYGICDDDATMPLTLEEPAASDLGFNTASIELDHEYPALTACWKDEIRARRAKR